jgi:hypothetical protein
MEWWSWLILAVAVLTLAALSALAVQARRRTGGVIAARRGPRPRKGGSI